MPATATATAVVVVVAVVEEAERVEGWRRVTGSRGCTEAAGWRARTSGSIRAPGATQGEKQQSASPFLPGKVLGHGTLSRALLAPVPLAKDDDKFRAAVKSGALSLFPERRSRGGHLPGKGSDRIVHAGCANSIRDQRSVRNLARTTAVSVARKRRRHH